MVRPGKQFKVMADYDVKMPTRGQENLNTVLGSLGTASFLGLNAGNILGGGCNGGGLFGGWNNRGGNCGCGSPWDMPVTRYELGMEQQLAYKDSEIALLKSNIFIDQKITETYKELRGMISGLQDFAARQSVQNQAFAD